MGAVKDCEKTITRFHSRNRDLASLTRAEDVTNKNEKEKVILLSVLYFCFRVQGENARREL